ncbi:MAG: hypothetical protein ABSG13_21140 [Bryobacteraceae bacterium]|jgi:hypothetical protein
MSYFQLIKGAATYVFDTVGGVSTGGTSVGSWTTNANNQIVTSSVAFDVSWVFNSKNQLTIQWNGAEIFNFAAAGLRSSFTTRNTALIVKPDRLAAFTFALQGDWAMSPDHNLTFTAGSVTSTLDGFVSDPLGRFIFHFANQDNVLETNVLGFAGSWQSKVDASGTPLLDFHYQTSSGEKVFELPKAITVNRSSNQLTYTYTKGNKNLSIDFQGMLMIGADFEISYVVQRQVSSSGDEMVSSTTLGFSATLTEPNLHGDLQLTLTKPDGTAGPSTLTIGGQCQGVLGKTNLQIGFTFTQTFGGAGNQITRTAAFNGTIAFNGGQVQWTFSSTGASINLAVGVDIKLGGVQVDARLNLPMAGAATAGVMAGVTFLLGVSF